MANSIKIHALAMDPSDDHTMHVLLEFILDAGKVAKVRNTVDDLANNKVEVHYTVYGQVGEPDHYSSLLTPVRTVNPYTSYDENHKFYVYAHEAGQADLEDDMDTSSAHRN